MALNKVSKYRSQNSNKFYMNGSSTAPPVATNLSIMVTYFINTHTLLSVKHPVQEISDTCSSDTSSFI